jgi:hypothetical protein
MIALPWISPADADDMLYDDPMGSSPGFGFALLHLFLLLLDPSLVLILSTPPLAGHI